MSTLPFGRCLAALLFLAPASLSAQSWLTYGGTVPGRYDYTCTAPPGTAPTPPAAGPVTFFFGKGEITTQGGLGRGKIDADGSVSGGAGQSLTWWGRFRRESDG